MTESVGFEISRQQREYVERRPAKGFNVVAVQVDRPFGVDAEVIHERIARYAAAHEALRTTLNAAAGLRLPLQNVHPALPVSTGGVDVDVEQGPVLDVVTTDDALVLTAHPAVADVPTLLQIAAAAHGVEPQVTDPIQYAEYAAWQAEQRAEAGEDADMAATAWTRIVGDGEPTVLADDFAPWADAGKRVVTADRSIDEWLTAWVITLARLTGDSTITLGVELDPRRDDELVGAAGPYVVIRPMQVEVPSTGHLATLVADVARLRELAGTWLEWAPDAAPCPLLFGLGPHGSRAARDRFQLELRVEPDGSSAEVVAGPDGTDALARTASSALSAVLASSVAGDLADIDVLSADAVASLLHPAPRPGPREHVLDLVAAAARAHPDRVALTDGTTALTYRQLSERVDALAAALVDAGADRGAPVALQLPRSVDLLVAMLAAMRCGAGYLPLDLDQPPARIAAQVDAAGSRVVVIADGDGLPGHTPVRLDASGRATLPELDGDALAYVIFTSGSTGTPKGVAVPARALTNYCTAVLEVVAPDGGRETPRAWGLVTSPTTDLGNTAIFPALVSGGTVHVVPMATVQDPVEFGRYQTAHRLDIVKITPSHLGALLADDRADVLPRELLFLGGEALPWSLVAEIRRRGSCRVVNHYGPTESTVGVLTAEVDEPPADSVGMVPIGRPLAGTEVLVLDARRRLVPDGAVGELAIGGAGLADGYLADAATTEERFVPHPYREGERVYLTGDLGRRGPDGRIGFLGRRDGQLKIRGFRVEVGEIEAALREHPSVRRAAVVLRDDVGPDAQLVGYVVVQVHPGPSEQDLHEHLRARVPDYMIPPRIVALDTLPLRPNGKLDTAALPVPPAASAREHVEPESELEKQVAGIFANVLGVDSVGVTDDFFELGGHSLLATKIIVAVRSEVGVDLPVYSLFESPTVRGIAERAAQAQLAAVDADELARLIAELDGMSDKEAAALLAAEGEDPGEREA